MFAANSSVSKPMSTSGASLMLSMQVDASLATRLLYGGSSLHTCSLYLQEYNWILRTADTILSPLNVEMLKVL
jgi:hypothetical protein